MRRRLLKTLTTLALSVLMIVSVISAFVLGIGADKPINALAEGEQTYTKVDLADIQSTDTIIIVSTHKTNGSYAMSNDKGTSAGPEAVKVTVDNNTITTAATNILWNISKDGDNLTIYPAGTTATWLYCTGTNKGVRVGTNTNKVFTVDAASGYLKHTATGRYLGVFNNADWRCYTSNTGKSNIVNQSFSFYKQETSTCEHDWQENSRVDATCTEDGSVDYKCSVCSNTKTETLKATGHNYENGVCKVCGAEKPATYALVTDVKELTIGSQIIIAAFDSDFALSTNQKTNNRGQAEVTKSEDKSEVTFEKSAGVQIITLENGKNDNTFAFNVGTKSYLYAASSSSNNLKTENSLSNNGSWKIEIGTNGVATITAQGANTRNILRYNSGSLLFSCYGSGQNDVSIYKLVEDTESDSEPVVKGVQLALNKGVTVKVTYDVPELWLNANAEAKVVFSNGQLFEAKAGENVYSVDLTPKQINDDLTVKIQLKDAVFGAETDVSVSAYQTKVKAAGKDKLGYSQEKFDALIDLIDAALTYSDAADGKDVTLKGSFADNETTKTTIVHANEKAKLFTGYAGTLGTYASVKVGVNTGNIPQGGDTLVIKVGTGENEKVLHNGKFASALNADGQIVIDEIYPLNFNDTIYIEASDGSSATFTFNAYLKAVYDSSTTDQTTVKNLALATYLYGLAAEAYNTAQ